MPLPFVDLSIQTLSMAAVGGPSGVREADDDIKQIAQSVRGDVESKAGTSFSKFEATHFTSQVVAGTIFNIKIDTGDNYAHVKVFRSLPPMTFEVQNVETGKTLEDAL
eukprot:TRINITY_DN10288_c0_g2_i3.p1 TRINITY_DN10288_c0_g2~~TRINITY_DN10288_c0_g2_i3.p1  ORF type:complete len:108 (+),score=23.06 TRINITY_DN10288_c0_g2_i3:632-955(+)